MREELRVGFQGIWMELREIQRTGQELARDMRDLAYHYLLEDKSGSVAMAQLTANWLQQTRPNWMSQLI
jgi:hypothetical protein